MLDGTHPAAQCWLEDLFRTLREDWGCTYGDLERHRLDILYPPTGQAMRFVGDTFDVGRLSLPDAEMVAVLNWQDTPRDFVVPITGRARVTELWSGQDLGVREGSLTLPSVPPHSGRLLRMVPAAVGSP